MATEPATGSLVRDEVLQARDSMGRLNAPVSVVRPSTWLQLAAGLLLVVGGLTWLIWGSAPDTVSGPGIFLSEDGLLPVVSTAEGLVISVDVTVEAPVSPGQALATLATSDGTETVIRAAEAGGRVVQLDIAPGSWVETGMTIARVLTTESPKDVLAVVRPSDAVRVSPGMAATLSPAGIPAAQYGSITATVSEVRTLPLSADRLATITAQNEALGQELSNIESGVLVLLTPNQAATPSGYEWTNGSGPDARLPLASPFTVTITIAERDPFGVLFSD